MQLERGELSEPDQRGAVVADDEVDHPDRAHLDGLGADPVRGVLGRPLLEEALPPDPVGEPDPGQGPVVEMGEQGLRDAGVVVDRLALGECRLRAAAPAAACRPQDLVEVGERDLAPVDLYLVAFALLRDRLLEVDLPLLGGGLGALASSPLTAASDSSSAAIRSGALVGAGSSEAAATTSSPLALRSISASTSSRYSSRYWVASNSAARESI